MKFISIILALVAAGFASYVIKYIVDHFNDVPNNETGMPVIMGFTAVLVLITAVITIAALRDYKRTR